MVSGTKQRGFFGFNKALIVIIALVLIPLLLFIYARFSPSKNNAPAQTTQTNQQLLQKDTSLELTPAPPYKKTCKGRGCQAE